MNFKKTKVAVASGLMAASMVLAPLAAYADQNTDESFTSATIQKTVNVADGVTIVGNIHFSVKQVPNQGDDATVAPNEDPTTHAIETIRDLKTDYQVETNNKTNASDDAAGSTHLATDFTYVKSVGLDFSELADPGEYTFVVKELKTDGVTTLVEYNESTGKGWTFSDAQYLVRVYVKNDSGHTKKYTIQKGTYNEKEEKWTPDSTDKTKKDTAAFENTYRTTGNIINNDNPSLKITKKVTANEYVSPNEEFEFTIKFEADKGSPATVPSTITPKNGKDYSWTPKVGAENTYTFKLKADETLEFEKLPAGIHYTVTESNFTNKLSTVSRATSNNIPQDEKTTDSGNNAHSTEKMLIGEKANSTEFTNTFKGITITGVVTHSAPFVIMVGALFVAVGGYVVLKKRIEE